MGLEPATSCVTGMRSNQLNYVPSRTVTSDERHLALNLALGIPPASLWKWRFGVLTRHTSLSTRHGLSVVGGIRIERMTFCL